MHASRILDNRFTNIRAFTKEKDCDSMSVVQAFDTKTRRFVAIKIMGISKADEMADEVAVNQLIPHGEPRLVKAIEYVQSYYG